MGSEGWNGEAGGARETVSCSLPPRWIHASPFDAGFLALGNMPPEKFGGLVLTRMGIAAQRFYPSAFGPIMRALARVCS